MIVLVTERLMYDYIELTGNRIAKYTKSCIVKTIYMVKATDVCDVGIDAKRQILVAHIWDVYMYLYNSYSYTYTVNNISLYKLEV